MFDIARIDALLAESLGEVDEDQNPLPGTEVIDLIVLPIAYSLEKVRENAGEMVELLKEWPSESWGNPVPPLGEVINYLTAGAVLDDQRRALVLFGFGKLAGLWDILEPMTLFKLTKDDPLVRELAGMGMISILGYRPQAAA